jgi:hypothetical protein
VAPEICARREAPLHTIRTAKKTMHPLAEPRSNGVDIGLVLG